MRTSRIRLIEIVVAVSVVVISVASLAVALFQGVVMQRALEAQVLPIIHYDTGNYDDRTNEWRMTFSIANNGLGPTEVRSFQMSWQDTVLLEAADLMVMCCVPEEIPEDQRRAYVFSAFQTGNMRIYTDHVQGRYFAPQQEITFIRFPRPDQATAPEAYGIWRQLDEIRHEIEVEVCYCSVFDDCWMARFPARSREPVRQCPAPTPL
jgi:hypothetical protein